MLVPYEQRPLPDFRGDSLVELLQWRAGLAPERALFTFLADGDADERRMTYGQLEARARGIASRLAAAGGEPGDAAVILCQPGLDYIAAFFGCLYAGVIAVPAYPPHPARLSRSLPKLRSIIVDCRAKLALADADLIARVPQLAADGPELAALRWLPVSPPGISELTGDWSPIKPDRERLAFLQYTSGSTAAPKGVMVSHGNLLHQLSHLHRMLLQTPEDRAISWLPPYHDMGLIGTILLPVYVGSDYVLMPPAAFLQRPIRWLKAISKYRASLSPAPNFAFELCVKKFRPDQAEGLDLTCWVQALNGAEPVRADTLAAFTATFAPYGFTAAAHYPCYGLAEATLMVSGSRKGEGAVVRSYAKAALQQRHAVRTDGPQAVPVAASGEALGQRLEIVDPDTRTPLPPEEVGEVWIHSPSVCQGYYGKPQETERTFRATLSTGEGPFLRTGDLGFRDPDGVLFIVGRIKDVIIVAGQNHYPQDLERTVEKVDPALRVGSCAAFALQRAGTEAVGLVLELEPRERGRSPAQLEELIHRAVRAVTDAHEVTVATAVLAQAGSVPVTSSGKIQRAACRELLLSDQLEVLARWPIVHDAA